MGIVNVTSAIVLILGMSLIGTSVGKINLDILTNSIGAGATLSGTTADNLKETSFSVAASGSIENYANDHLRLIGCDIETGEVNIPFRDVSSGLREGFASHKSGLHATGSWIGCQFKIYGDTVHLMYSVPYSHDLHKNTLAVGVCSSSDPKCKNLDATKMFYDTTGKDGLNSLFSRKEYYNYVRKTHFCGPNVCVTGTMGSSHKPTIHFKIFPKSFNNLATASKDTAAKDRWNPKDYERFILTN